MEKFIFILLFSMAVFAYGEDAKRTAASVNIGIDEFEPFTYQEGNAVTGYTVEVVQRVLNNMGIASSIKIYPWARIVNMFKDGETDILVGVFQTDERRKLAWFPAEPTGAYKYVMIIRKEDVDKIKYRSFEDLKGRSIGLQRETAYSKELLEYAKQNAKLEYVTNIDHNFLKLERKRFDCVIEEIGVAVASIRKLRMQDKLVILEEPPVFQDNFYTALSKKRFREEDARKFSDTLKAFKATDDYKKICVKYFLLK